MYQRYQIGRLIIAITSFVIGLALLFNEILRLYQAEYFISLLRLDIPFLSALLGFLFIFKGFFWSKSCLVDHRDRTRKIDYIGLLLAIYVFYIATKVLQTGILNSKSAWFYLESPEKQITGGLLIFAGIGMVYDSIECRIKK